MPVVLDWGVSRIHPRATLLPCAVHTSDTAQAHARLSRPLAHIANNEEEADEESICRRNRFFQKKEKNGPYKNKRKCN